MLVLTRTVDERILLETPIGRITLMIVAQRGEKVKVGIDAPECVEIYREEVWVAKQQEAENAA